jgi:zinc-ribbon domain
VEHPCHQCGAAVDDGVAFCPQCNAPQIRVASPGVEAHEGGEPSPLPLTRYSGQVPTATIHWPQALPAAGLAVLVAAVPLTFLGVPVGLGMLVSGFVSVVFYRRRIFFMSLTAGLGARLGAASGALGFGVMGLLLALVEPVFHSWEKLHQTMLEILDRSLARNPNPQGEQIIAFFKTPQGFALAIVMVFVGFLIFAALGGVLGAVLLRKRERS